MKRATPLAIAFVTLAASALPLAAQAVAYTGAILWDGTGAAPVRGATIVVQDGRISQVGAAARPPSGAQVVPLDGKYVTPGLIDTHAHVSGDWAPDDVTDEMERVRATLRLFALYGVTTVNSLGDDETVLAVRGAATPLDPRARVLAAGPVVASNDPAQARAAATANADAGVDWLKLRVDDNLGTTTKMPWDAVQAVIDVGKERGLRVATHLFYLDDAKRLLEMGTGMIAHSVRDTAVDQDFVAALRESGACYVPTLVREVSTFTYATRPAWFDEPFFAEHADSAEVARLSDPAFQQQASQSRSAAGYRRALREAMHNLKALHDAGIPIAFGTDAGPAARFPGYFEHMELQLMVGAGLTAEEAMLSATSVAAACLGRDDVGTLEAGRWADFLVFESDPVRDIMFSRTLEQVYVAGNRVR
jgi:imidazolonepropionase-like amidohydrolase